MADIKRCTKCAEVKPFSKFSRDTSRHDGHQTACKACNRRYYESNRAAVLDRMRSYYVAHPEAVKERVRRWEQHLRPTVFAHYGSICACCGTTEDLTIDHIDGGGDAHRKELFGNSRKAGGKFYAWLIRNGFPGGFQTLCHPCNGSKREGERCKLTHSADV